VPPTATAPVRRQRITEVCFEGDHSSCLGTVYVWPLPPQTDADYLVLCECEVCHHRLATYGAA
jgi:hypothetical protein